MHLLALLLREKNHDISYLIKNSTSINVRLIASKERSSFELISKADALALAMHENLVNGWALLTQDEPKVEEEEEDFCEPSIKILLRKSDAW